MRVIERNSIAYSSVDLFTKQNRIKDQQLDQLYFVYKKAYTVALSYMLFAFYNTHSETPFKDIKPMSDKAILERLFTDFLGIASKRLLTTVYNQAYADFKSHIKLIRYYIIEATKKTHSMSDNKSLYHDFKKEIRDYKFTTNRVLHSIFRHVTKRLARKPSLKLKNMMLDSQIVKIEKAKETKLFDRWIRIAPLKGQKAIYIPYKSSNYKDRNALNAYQFVRIDNSFSIRIVQTVDRVEYNPSDKIVGIDLGLTDFFATSSDKILGNGFMNWLKKHDEILTKLKASLQKQGIKPRQSKKYRKLVQKIRDYTKNEVCRLFNLVMKHEKPKVIRLEFLDFRNQNLGKITNRLLTRLANKIIAEKVQRLVDVYGVEVEYINAAYTSQTCLSCGYIAKNNRDGRKFKCHCCGHKANANTQASKNIARRSSDSLKLTKKQALTEGLKIFLKNHKVKRLETNIFSIRARSCARTAIVNNPYLENYFASSNLCEVV